MAQSVDGVDEWELSESMVIVLPQKPMNITALTTYCMRNMPCKFQVLRAESNRWKGSIDLSKY